MPKNNSMTRRAERIDRALKRQAVREAALAKERSKIEKRREKVAAAPEAEPEQAATAAGKGRARRGRRGKGKA